VDESLLNISRSPISHALLSQGKGCNQAIACAKLSSSKHQAGEETKVSFLGQFGNDSASVMLREALVNNNVDVSPSGQSKLYPSGRGYVMIVPETGEVCAVVSGGSNLYGWEHWGVSRTDGDGSPTTVDGSNSHILSDRDIGDVVSSHSLLLLQCEIPCLVNLRLAREARKKLNIPVLLDVGGEDRKMERELLECCDYLIPNETELERLAESCTDASFDVDLEDGSLLLGMTRQELDSIQEQIGSTLNLPAVIKSIRTLQRNGANNVLVTLGSHGSILMKKEKQHSSPALPSRRPLIYRPACKLPAELTVVDETGAGDCYRAGFAVALLENCIGNSLIGKDDDVDDEVLEQCMKFASAAGALAVTRKGAAPSIPSRVEVEKLLSENSKDRHILSPSEGVPRGGGHKNDEEDDFPFLFGSRINSMKDRLDLVEPSMLPLSTPRDYLRRMATICGLGCVDFNFPQHFDGYWTPEEAKKALDEVNLVAGAVCLRYPSKFARGAMNHPNAELRREAIEITKKAAEAARILGCNEVVVWSAYDGYDYPFQVSYKEKWDQIVQAFQECCDAYPDLKWSLEFKPTDENTRFFTVPSTGAAMLLVNEIDRPNMGLTLDMGHMLMAGENPGQSIALVGEKLFGIQLNDGYTRLAAEDGMMFGSIHPSIALEALYQLRQINFSGHLYFDTFPQRTDPVKEAEYNIRRVKEFWSAVTKMDATEVARITREHDAIGALELVSEALKR
jgi:sugar/nucleoside kinase (ribokinase family)/sugar phosphate isomerase/epimerase